MNRCPKCGKKFEGTTCPLCGSYYGAPGNGAEIKRLQKKLIPVNLLMSIISLIACFTLLFAPIVKIDVGNFLRSDEVASAVNIYIDSALQESDLDGVDIKPVAETVVSSVLNSVNSKVKITAFSSAKVAFAKPEEKSAVLFDDILYNEKDGLVKKLVDGLTTGIRNMFTVDKAATEKIIVKAISTTAAEKLTEALKSNGVEFSGSIDADALTDIMLKLNTVQSDDDVKNVTNEFINTLTTQLGTNDLVTEEDREAVTNEILNFYHQTMEEVETFSLEAMICVALSGIPNIGDIIDGIAPKGEEGGETEPTKALVDEGAEVDPDQPTTDEGDEKEPVTPTEPTDPEPTEPTEPEEPAVVYTTYEQLLNHMLPEDLDTKVTDMVKSTLDGAMSSIDPYIGYYGYIFYGMLGFVAIWFIQFLFAFLHTFSKNKRFMMWYTKLLGCYPFIIFWGGVTALKGLIKGMAAELGLPAIIIGLVHSLSSAMWIIGVCYLLMWAISIFWAFPIKHKIRKLMKEDKIRLGR